MSVTRSELQVEKTEATGERGMVVADDARAAEAGVAMLRQGGNAIDAAVAAAFVMGVVEPLTSGVGGVAAAVIHLAREGRTVVVDGAGLAPRATTPDMFELLEGETAGMYGWPATRGNEHNEGARSVGVPGMVAALFRALERYGRLDRARVLAPAIDHAERPEPVGWYLASTLGSYAERLWKDAEATRIFMRPSRAPLRPELGLEPGDRLAQPDLGRTLRRLAEGGADLFYRGELAAEIVDGVRARGGVLTREDLAGYEPRELEALRSPYRDVEVWTLPGASGGTTVVEALNLLDLFPEIATTRDPVLVLHLVAEASRLAFLDRFAYLSADDDARVALVTSRARAKRMRDTGRIDASRAHPEATAEGDEVETTHVSAVDADGNAVALTSTLGQAFGSGVVPRGTGVLLSDVMTWFDPRPGRTNSIAGGKRILWAIAPALVLKDGRTRFVIGAPGGRRLISAVVQSIVNLVDRHEGPQRAVNGIRVHCEGERTLLDARASAETRAALERMGHHVEIAEETFVSSYFGRPNAIAVDDDGTLRGGVNRLKPSTAIGV